MDNDGKFRIKKIYVLAAILILLLVYVSIGTIRFYRDMKEHQERVNNGELDDYHNQPNNIYGAPIVYFRSDLERIVGVRLEESDAKIAGYTCKRYRNKGNEKTKYDHLRFYIFKSEKQAKKALEKIKENSFSRITDEGERYVRGWLDGIIDAQIEDYFYVNGNLMVVATVTSVNENARDEKDLSSPVMGGGTAALDLIKMIYETF